MCVCVCVRVSVSVCLCVCVYLCLVLLCVHVTLVCGIVPVSGAGGGPGGLDEPAILKFPQIVT